MKILIIGNGFLASQIVKRLEAEGNELLIFSRRSSVGIKAEQVIGDIFDFDNFVKVLDWEPQVVIHTAWITTPKSYKEHPSNFEYANFTSRLAQSLLGSKVEHFIVLGTCAEYLQEFNPSLQGIENPASMTLYAEQKIRAFNSVSRFLGNSEIRFTWARVFFPYGPGQHPLRLIPTLLSSLKNGEPICLSDTSSVHDWITTRDVASAISWILRYELTSEIDIGTSIGFTNLEILTTLEELLGINHKRATGKIHEVGLNQILLANKETSLFSSGWIPKDSLVAGLAWVLE
jgi:nucleoside-diphosphate-sugar epimerase